jgi:hypothetical protein
MHSYKRLAKRRATWLVRTGWRIAQRLRNDPRLQAAADVLDAAQSRLEARVDAWETAVKTEDTAAAERAGALRSASATLRELGYIALSATGGHHDGDPYLIYYPDGYGEATRLPAAETIEFERVLLGKLEQETDPSLVGYRDRIAATRDALISAEAAYATAANAQREAYGLMQAERRSFARGMTETRALAEAACHSEPAYLRVIFAPAEAHRRNNASEQSEDHEAPAHSGTSPEGAPEPLGAAG